MHHTLENLFFRAKFSIRQSRMLHFFTKFTHFLNNDSPWRIINPCLSRRRRILKSFFYCSLLRYDFNKNISRIFNKPCLLHDL